jgi:hypothetical protein
MSEIHVLQAAHALLPRPAKHLSHGDVIRLRDCRGERRTFVIALVDDPDHGAPWENSDGHGPVSGWTTRRKEPGELVLCQDRQSFRYYDFAEACRIAARDGWNAEPYDVPGETTRQRAAKAAMADYAWLEAWCDNEWHYVGVCVFELPRDGVERHPEHVADRAPFGILKHTAFWGVESNSPDYHESIAYELATELL